MRPSDAGGDAGARSGYGDGRCTEQEFREGNEAIEISTSLAVEGPGAVSAWVDLHQEMLDGIWADCVERFCPIAKRITDECLANFATDDDAGPAAFGPSCYPLPAECEALLADAA